MESASDLQLWKTKETETLSHAAMLKVKASGTSDFLPRQLLASQSVSLRQLKLEWLSGAGSVLNCIPEMSPSL